MYNGEAISELLPTMKAFPEPSDIFISEQSWLAKHFLPLLSIDLGELRPELAGTIVHMLNPIEPYDGHIGQNTRDYHTKYCGENFYAFRLTDDNRYEFLADEGYFLRSAFNKGELLKDYQADTSKFNSYTHNQEKIATYLEAKERFQKTGKLTKEINGSELRENNFLDHFGGRTFYNNWTDSFASYEKYNIFPLKNTFYRLEEGETVGIHLSAQLFCKDEPFFFVGDVAGYNWCSSGADEILMFYEPKNRIVLFTLNFT